MRSSSPNERVPVRALGSRVWTTCACTTILGLAACAHDEGSSLRVFGTHDKSVDFSEYQTYDVVEPDDVPEGEIAPRAYLEANRVAVIHSIIGEMEARGYVRERSDPDLLVSPLVRLENVENVVVESPYWYDYYYGWYWDYGYPWYAVDVIQLEAGTLIIDAVDVGDPADVEDDQLVFRGYATAILPRSPTDVSDRIPGVVAEIFDFWPDVRPDPQPNQ
jgi:hypothetical protein